MRFQYIQENAKVAEDLRREVRQKKEERHHANVENNPPKEHKDEQIMTKSYLEENLPPGINLLKP